MAWFGRSLSAIILFVVKNAGAFLGFGGPAVETTTANLMQPIVKGIAAAKTYTPESFHAHLDVLSDPAIFIVVSGIIAVILKRVSLRLLRKIMTFVSRPSAPDKILVRRL